IEINDNPNLDIGYEDAADGVLLYEDLIDYFVRRIEAAPMRTGTSATTTAPQSRGASTRNGTRRRHFRPFEVAGLEIEYAVVDRDLNAVSLVAPALRSIAGRPTSDVDLGMVAFSNEIADHVIEVKMPEPSANLALAEAHLADGVQRFS